VENWKQVTNFDYGLSDPHAPDKAQAIKTLNSQNLPENIKEIKQQIGTAIAEQISNGNIQNRQDVVNTLENAGFEITRQTERSISIKNPDGKRNIRLEGVIYENRQFDKQFAEEHSRAGQDYQRTSRERYETALGKLHRLVESKQRANQEILSSNLQTIQDQQPKIRNALRLNILTGTVLGVLITVFLIFLGVNFWLGSKSKPRIRN
jgi:Fe2+ transport system protein B